MQWVVDFFMNFMNIMSQDKEFPSLARMRALVEQVAEVGTDNPESKLTGRNLETYFAARKYFHYLPATFNELNASWFESLDKAWDGKYDSSSSFDDASEWESNFQAYTEAVIDELEKVAEETSSGEKGLSTRATSRMLYYLTFLAGGLYLPSPRALEHTVKTLMWAGAGIAQVNALSR